MEKVARPRKLWIVLFWGLPWGCAMALLTWFSNWHDTGRIGSVYNIVARFAYWALMGVVFGILMWRSLRSPSQRKASGTGAIVKTVLFWVLMAFLAFLLWKIW